MAIEDGGPAFPSHGSMGEVVCEGMSLRDYFATKALEGDWASQNINNTGVFTPECSKTTLERSAKMYYRMADAMLAAREVQS